MQLHTHVAHMMVVLLLASFMRQAGEGADYLEGCEGARSQRCFKCGAVGHWAAECRGLEVRMTQLYSNIAGPSGDLTEVFLRRSAVRQQRLQSTSALHLWAYRRTARRAQTCQPRRQRE